MKTLLLTLLVAIVSSLDLRQYSSGFSAQLGLNAEQVASGQDCFNSSEVIIRNFRNAVRSSLGSVEVSTTDDLVQYIKLALMETCPAYEKDVKKYLITNIKAADIKGVSCPNLQTFNTQIQQKLTLWASAMDNQDYSTAGAIQADIYKIIFGLVNPTDPTAAFTVSKNNRIVSFDGRSSSDPDGSVVSYSWNFGEPSSTSNTATGSTPTHIYLRGGTYLVSLTVTDNSGATATSSRMIDVSGVNFAPTANFTVTRTYLAVSFDAAGSTDSDGTIANYAWDFGESGSSSNTTSGATTTTSHTYATGGTYTVTLTVTDNDGETKTFSQNVTVVANVPPTATFISLLVTGSLTVNFNAAGSTDSDGNITNYAWNFGEPSSSSNTASGSTASASHTYAGFGTYTVNLTTTDNAGATTTISRSIRVTGGSVTAAFTSSVSYSNGNFDASTSTDTTGGTITSYAWNFGESSSSANTGSGVTTGHAYMSTGTFTVTLTVTNSYGMSAIQTGTVSVAIVVPGGNLQFMSEWNRNGDGDMVVATPNNKYVYYGNRGPNAGTDNASFTPDSATRGPENVYWDASYTPPTGTYHVCFQLYSFSPLADAANPVIVQLKAMINGIVKLSVNKTYTGPRNTPNTCNPSLDTYLASYTFTGCYDIKSRKVFFL